MTALDERIKNLRDHLTVMQLRHDSTALRIDFLRDMLEKLMEKKFLEDQKSGKVEVINDAS